MSVHWNAKMEQIITGWIFNELRHTSDATVRVTVFLSDPVIKFMLGITHHLLKQILDSNTIALLF